MKKYVILKLIGLAILVMIVLVILSFLEVAIYSYLINPGQAQSVYEAHANFSAPYISGVFGFIIFFIISRYWKQKKFESALKLAILFPITYIFLDVIVLIAANIKLSEFLLISVIANSAKFIGSYLGFKLTK